jgi:type IV pilus assembly protein PilP
MNHANAFPVRRLASAGTFAALAAVLGGCDSGSQDIQAWMDETRRNTPVVITKLVEPKKFVPFRYEANGEIDPFSVGKLKVGLAPAGPARGSDALRPDASRPREPLEALPLDNLTMVGSLRRDGVNVALLRADTALHQVRVGNYIGQNFGRVLQISEVEVAIRETVQDAAGDWVQRDTALRLQETEK